MKQPTWGDQFTATLTKHIASGGLSPELSLPVAEQIPVHPMSMEGDIDTAFLRLVGGATLSARFRGYVGSLEGALAQTKSPIEKAMLSALIVAGYVKAKHVRLRYSDGVGGHQELGDDGSCYPFLFIEAQRRVGAYQVDFFLSYFDRIAPHAASPGFRPTHFAELIVECDGHDYHDRTREQASADRKRDRTLQNAGYKVFRYTGRDIWADVFECARETLDAVTCRENMRIYPSLESKGRPVA